MQGAELSDVVAANKVGGANKSIIPKSSHHSGKGHYFTRMFTDKDSPPNLTLTSRSAQITDGAGEIIFEQPVDDVPDFWSDNAVNIVASKYFRGHMGTPERERSVMKVIERVAGTITAWGLNDNYFADVESAEIFHEEMVHMLAHQMFSFNSPVWFNVGVEDHPQCSACFLLSVEDSMESIMNLAATEARLFKGGSGAGSNLSTLRSSKEGLTGGGRSSGPISFMRGFDAFAGSIKSGGKTRRAAKMVLLNANHPDIMEFVQCKAKEEKKAWALIDAGYDGTFTGEAYASVSFQNANHSIRVSDEFMRAAVEDMPWDLKAVTTGQVVDTVSAKNILMEAAKATHICGDPGLQYDTTINTWHTCKGSGRINTSNPCSEVVFLDDVACNLASINLLKFHDEDTGEFYVDPFEYTCRLVILAQEIMVDNSSYPTDKVAQNSHDYRILGLGYTNLGAVIMANGLPYDSKEGRDYAAAITALMTGSAYAMSAEVAMERGPFPGWCVPGNSLSMCDVMGLHNSYVAGLDSRVETPTGAIAFAAKRVWADAINGGFTCGWRNAQISVAAPTGTISFMMDADTTGIEPDIALVKYKRLVGGGMLKMVNATVPPALYRLGYTDNQVGDIVDYIDKTDTIEGAPHLDPVHLPVFDCAFKAKSGTRTITPEGHILMMAAIQPFFSGALSKTVNVPESATVEDIFDLYAQAWKLGIKALAIYRDGSKRSQPLSTSKAAQSGDGKEHVPEVAISDIAVPRRRKMPRKRPSETHKFAIGGHEGYMTVGFYPEGTPGEVFIGINKQGSTVSGLVDTIAIFTSLCLQYGIPLDALVKRFSHMRFEPAGITGSPEVPIAKSITDYIFRYLGAMYLESKEPDTKPDVPVPAIKAQNRQETVEEQQSGAPLCFQCGAVTRRSGSCYVCGACGTSTGCA